VVVRAGVSRAALARLAADVLRAERVRVQALSVTLVGPSRIRALNRVHLGRDRVTDVIAFAFAPVRGGPIVGDVYVCPRVAAAQARALGIPAREELRRLVVHGVLHVTGHDHPAGPSRTRSPMWRRQERYLARFGGNAR